jgi:hypothetical protein
LARGASEACLARAGVTVGPIRAGAAIEARIWAALVDVRIAGRPAITGLAGASVAAYPIRAGAAIEARVWTAVVDVRLARHPAVASARAVTRNLVDPVDANTVRAGRRRAVVDVGLTSRPGIARSGAITAEAARRVDANAVRARACPAAFVAICLAYRTGVASVRAVARVTTGLVRAAPAVQTRIRNFALVHVGLAGGAAVRRWASTGKARDLVHAAPAVLTGIRLAVVGVDLAIPTLVACLAGTHVAGGLIGAGGPVEARFV